jgi:phosphatidylserine decarboxylase
LELEVEPEDMAELLASHDEPLTDEDLIWVDQQRRLLLEMESTADDDTETISEMRKKNLEHYGGLLDTVVAGFERIDNNFERSSAVGKILSNGIAC